jgi:hypothetical protein
MLARMGESSRIALAVTLALSACADPGPRHGASPAQQVRSDGAPPAHDAASDDAAHDAALDDAALDDAALDDAAERDAAPERDARPERDAAPDDCPLGAPCNPIPIDELPFRDSRDTRDAPSAAFDAYACAPDTDESGPEVVYRVDVAEPGLLGARIEEEPRDGIDVDVHLLAGRPDPDACVARDHVGLNAQVQPGTYYVVVDTWVNGDGMALPGPYTLDVDFRPQANGACAMTPTRVRMFWRSCDPGIAECVDDGGIYLDTPATGPVVKEAHLVTVADDFGGGWPASARDHIDRHYQLSQQATGFVARRDQDWAPAGEGGSRFGEGSYGRPLPVEDESWYLNMYWRQPPDPGTRMIVINPENGRAVVAAGGYETGPGSNTAIAGVTEEIHAWLGTQHRSVLQVGFAADPSLPLGPIDCAF